MKKLWKITLCCLLATLMTLTCATPAFAARKKATYISEIKMAYGTSEEAKKDLEAAGYVFLDKNLNSGNKTGTYIGYKTTTDPNDAITDISLMQMDGGYTLSTYEELLKQQKENIASALDVVKTVIAAYRTNYKAGTANAIYANKMMNVYKEDDTKELLGDLLLNESKCTDTVLTSLILESNSMVLAVMYKAISIGSVPYGDNNWMSKLSALGKVDMSLEAQYNVDAQALKELADNMRGTLKKCIALNAEVEAAVKDVAEADKADAIKAYLNGTGMSETATAANMVLVAILDNYKYGDGTLLDFFLNEKLTVADYHPMASVISESELAAMKLSGMTLMVQLFNNTAEAWAKIEADYSNLIPETQEPVSVYYGVDRLMYKNNVAVTSAASRNSVNGLDAFDPDAWSKAAIGRTILASIAGAAAVTMVVTAIVADSLRIVSDHVYTEYGVEYLAVTWDFIESLTGTGSHQQTGDYVDDLIDSGRTELGSAKYTITTGGIVFSAAFAVLAVAAVIEVVFELTDFYEEHYNYSPKPEIMFDYISTASRKAFVRYNAVYKTDKTTVGDLNCDGAERWICMYTTKDQSAGAPIKTGLLVQSTVDGVDSVYEGVHWFGNISAANLNAYTRSGSIFMFFDRDEDAITASNTASVFSTGTIVLISTLSALGGAGICFVGMFAVSKRKKKGQAEE